MLHSPGQCGDLEVFQPHYIERFDGESVILHCSYTSVFEPKGGRYWWLKDPGLEVKPTRPEFRGRLNSSTDERFLLCGRADIKLWDLRPSDSGIYYCIVHIDENLL
uniref:Natural cytotoxicity triggering receptor 3 n=1 Tax=Salvator merianae TaxID=96440 RepID=A0A8D0DT50_SALMN